MGGFFSSPSSIESAATANEYRARPNYFRKNNNAANTSTNASANANAAANSSAGTNAPATRRNRRTNLMMGGKRRKSRTSCTRKRR